MTTRNVTGRHIAHVQIAYLGSRTAAVDLVAPLRKLKPLSDSLEKIGYEQSHTVFCEPEQPHAYVGDNLLVSAVDADRLSSTVVPSAPGRSVSSIVSIRHLGGALSEPALGSSPNFTFGRPNRRAAAKIFDAGRRDRLRRLAFEYDPGRLLRPSFILS